MQLLGKLLFTQICNWDIIEKPCFVQLKFWVPRHIGALERLPLDGSSLEKLPLWTPCPWDPSHLGLCTFCRCRASPEWEDAPESKKPWRIRNGGKFVPSVKFSPTLQPYDQAEHNVQWGENVNSGWPSRSPFWRWSALVLHHQGTKKHLNLMWQCLCHHLATVDNVNQS